MIVQTQFPLQSISQARLKSLGNPTILIVSIALTILVTVAATRIYYENKKENI